MAISKQHFEFIKLVSEGIDYATAYATACSPTATRTNCKSQGSRLAKKYAKEITEAKNKYKKAIEQAYENKDVQNALNEILTQAEVDILLCRIIKGEFIDFNRTNSKGKIVKQKVCPTIAERRAAIETYNKRFGSNGAVKIDVQNNLERLNLYLQRPEDKNG